MKNVIETVETVETATTKKAKVKKPKSNLSYGVDVLALNSDYKKAIGTVGGVRQVLIDLNTAGTITLHPCFVKLLNDSKAKNKQGKAIYEFLKDNVYHHPKTNKTGVFFMARSMAKMLKIENFENLCNVYNNAETAKIEYRNLLGIEQPENTK
jgi:hypothetical protein